MQLLDPYKKIAVAVAVLSLNACALVAHQSTKTSAPQAAQSAMADSDYRRAVTAAKAGREEDASKLFTAVTKSHPDSAAAYINLGLIELKRDNLHTAKTALVHAAALAPRPKSTTPSASSIAAWAALTTRKPPISRPCGCHPIMQTRK